MKIFSAAVFACLVGMSAFAAGNGNPQRTEGWNFALEGTFGARFGKEGEIVWGSNSRSGGRYKMSELEWEYTPALYLGAKLAGGYKRLEISFSPIVFLPTGWGAMKDSDWLQDACYGTGNTSVKTNYSESDNKVKSGFELWLSFAFKFYPTDFLTLRPMISAAYTQMEFNASGGRLWYGNGQNKDGNKYYYPYDDAEHSFSRRMPDRTIVRYRTQSLYLWTGVQADFIPARRVVLSVATEAAPIVYMYSHDQHVMKEVEYRQKSLSAFFAARQSARAQFNFKDSFSIALNFAAVLTGETSGPTYIKEKDGEFYRHDGNGSGAYSMFFDIGLSAKFLL